MHQSKNAFLEGVGPVGNFQSEDFLELGLVEHGVCGTGDLRGELVGVAGVDVACRVAGIFGYRLGEVVP